MAQGISRIIVDGKSISSGSLVDACWIESIDLELSDAELYVDALKAELKDVGDTTALLYLGWKYRQEENITWEEPVPLRDFDPIHWTRFTGRFLRLRIEDTTPSTLWKLSSLELFGHKSGGRL